MSQLGVVDDVAADRALLLREREARRNEELFGIRLADLLRVNGEMQPASKVYRKVEVKSLDVLH